MSRGGGLAGGNFAHLASQDPQLARLGALAERYLADDPNTCLLKLRQLAELLARQVAARAGLLGEHGESQYELLARLRDRELLPREVHRLFSEVRRAGNAASHALAEDAPTALRTLRLGWQLGLWFQRTFGDPDFVAPPFYEPTAAAPAERQRAEAAVAADASAAEARLAAQQATAGRVSRDELLQLAHAGLRAATRIELDETETRQLIDAQLREAGWTVDSRRLRYALGARPQAGEARAIAEWPTASGPADYVLFQGLTPVAVVEAKRQRLDVPALLDQAERYSRDFALGDELASPGGPWRASALVPPSADTFRVPFVFATNGRPHVPQLSTRSGVWFRDLRRPQNLPRPLDGWYTPEGLARLLALDVDRAHTTLADTPLTFGFALRPYQEAAIRSVEAALARGDRRLLVAMATGTGKTKTAIALVYRLLTAQRFRRVLFVVDRTALGQQASDAFVETPVAGLQTFTDIFHVASPWTPGSPPEGEVTITTIQGLVRRVLQPAEGEAPLPVDAYDCLVVDECHRGYLLDRELSETEASFRDFDDYVSKYRRALEAFDAVRLGLTATPALHTTQIFDPPVFTYSYREAVVDGYLADHEPPIAIETELSRDGIHWQVGETLAFWNTATQEFEPGTAPDALDFEVADFHRRVVTRAWNEVVCQALALELDPWSRLKTLVFCVDDAHADLVTELLRAAFAAHYDTFEPAFVAKITGQASDPAGLLRAFRNERVPNVAVTVDLLTTGIDVPAIANLVFLRRVNSRILFEQMLGRATRLCPEAGKEVFRIYDAVGAYAAVAPVSTLRPVAPDPKRTFAQLFRELATVRGDAELTLVREELLARLERLRSRPGAAAALETVGLPLGALLSGLRSTPLPELPGWLGALPVPATSLADLLDTPGPPGGRRLAVSEHPDALVRVEAGYGPTGRAEDYLESFRRFLTEHQHEIPALLTLLTRPRELTRAQLREVQLALDRAGFPERQLESAWHAATNREIAARIVGFIRQAALGDPLLPYAERVDRALAHLLARRDWTRPQRDWLRRLAEQTKVNVLVDRSALEDPDLLVWQDAGGFTRLNAVFDGQLEQVLADFNDAIWTASAA